MKTADGSSDGNTVQVQSIVDRVAQVPSFLKTILLIQKKADRKRILSYKIVKRVMFSPFSVMHEADLRALQKTTPTGGGQLREEDHNDMENDDDMMENEPKDENSTSGHLVQDISNVLAKDITQVFSPETRKKKNWLVRMLERGYKPIKKIAVDYLELLSALTEVDYILEEGVDPTPMQIREFRQAREDIFSRIQNLSYLIPAMISLEDGEKERAAMTAVVRRILDNAVIRPFGITLLFCDLVFHVVILFGWREIVFDLVDIADDNDDTKNSSRRDVHLNNFFEYMFAIGAVYFTWRLIGEIFSSLIASWRVFKVNFTTFWTLLDVATIVMAYISFRVIVVNDDVVYSPGWFRFFSILTGLFWLKLLSFLKVVNQSLATFVLAIIQIIKDVKWIVFILVMVIAAFADMFYILIKTDIEVCPAGANGDNNPYCDHGLSYLDIFIQILGQFDYGSYLGSPMTIVLFIVMTVFGAIIFLNILIAVVDDSYSNATAKSAKLFGRARILTVAKIDALEHIMEPKWVNKRDSPMRRVSTILFKLLTLICFGYAIYGLIRFIMKIDTSSGVNAGVVIASILMAVVFIGTIIVLTFMFTGWGEKRKYRKWRIINDNPLILWIYWKPMVCITKLMLGLTTFSNQSSDEEGYDEDLDDDGWSERMITIDGMINDSVNKSESHLVEKITSLEMRLDEYEGQRATEMEGLKDGLASLGRDNLEQRALLENMSSTK